MFDFVQTPSLAETAARPAAVLAPVYFTFKTAARITDSSLSRLFAPSLRDLKGGGAANSTGPNMLFIFGRLKL